MSGPSIAINLSVISSNTKNIVSQCAKQNIEVCGVTKATCGLPLVARAMLQAGATMLGESRIDNVKRLRVNGVHAPIMMLRIPSVSEVDEVVALCEISLNSERDTLKALSEAAIKQSKTHDVIIMLDMGDRREGVAQKDLLPLCEYAHAQPGLSLVGIGGNFMCVNGILPSPEKMQRLNDSAIQVEEQLGITLRYVSGGNSANLATLNDTVLPEKINQLRIGASILLGENPITGDVLTGLRNDAFTLEAELIEIQLKPSMPEGEIARDAFGEMPQFEDKGMRVRGIVNLGRVDIRHQGLSPNESDVEIITASSDHLLVDLTDARRYSVGDTLNFLPDYGALLQAMLSPYITKRLCGREQLVPKPRRLRLFAEHDLIMTPACKDFLKSVAELGLQPLIGGSSKPGDLPLYIASNRAKEQHLAHAELGVLCIDSEPGDVTVFPPENSVLLGLRSATPEQINDIHQRQMMALTMEEIDLLGARESIRRALQKVTETTDGFALILHATAAKGMDDDPLESGLSYRECSLMMERIAADRGLRAITLSGIHADKPSTALDIAFGYLLSALGKHILGLSHLSLG